MPPDAACVRAAAGVDQVWSAGEHLAAAAVDELRVANWLTVELHKRKGAANPPPVPVTRPGDPPPRPPGASTAGGPRRQSTDAEIARFLART